MKLVIAGATGFVGTEVLRQSLRASKVTSVVALSRRPIDVSTSPEPGTDTSKLKSIIVESYDKYSNEAKAELATADACIWTVAITPSKSSQYEWDEVRRVCYDSPLACLQATLDARSHAAASSPFRFMYMSGAKSERDQTKTPSFKPKYSLLRGEAETAVLELAKKHSPSAEACVVKPGFITAQNDYLKMAFGFALSWVVSLPTIDVKEISVAMIDQAVNGFEKETLENDDLKRLGEGKV